MLQCRVVQLHQCSAHCLQVAGVCHSTCVKLLGPNIAIDFCNHFGFKLPRQGILPSHAFIAAWGREGGHFGILARQLFLWLGAALPVARVEEPAGNLAEAHEEGQPVRTRRRQLGRRSSEEQVERSIQEHFGHLPKIATECKHVDGMTLRQRVRQDLHAAEDQKEGRLGATYWRGLVQLYGSGVGINSMQIKDVSQPVGEALEQAPGAAINANPAARSIEPLTGFLQHCETLNQKEFVGLCKAVSANKHMGKDNNDALLLEIMKYVVRLKQQETVAEEIQPMVPICYAALSRQYTRLKKAGVKVPTWLETHQDLAAMLMDSSDLMSVISANGK